MVAVVRKLRSTKASSVVVSVAPTDLVSVEPGLVHYTGGQNPGRPPPTLRRWSQGLLNLRELGAGPSDPACHGGG